MERGPCRQQSEETTQWPWLAQSKETFPSAANDISIHSTRWVCSGYPPQATITHEALLFLPVRHPEGECGQVCRREAVLLSHGYHLVVGEQDAVGLNFNVYAERTQHVVDVIAS